MQGCQGGKTIALKLRDIVVTHVRSLDHVTERELEALATYMGHSLAQQRNVYDKRTKDQRVAPAMLLMQALRANAESSLDSQV